MNIVNIAAYKFIKLNALDELRDALKQRCLECQLKGTILLSAEGINIMLAGSQEGITAIQNYLNSDSRFADLYYKTSYSDKITFNRMLVKIKKEIISMGVTEIDPEHQPAPRISAAELKQWLDENKDFVLLDTRNDYEFAMGSFDNAVDLNIKHFRQFPQAVEQANLPKDKPIVTFCTGGIRCEKAAVLMQKKGFSQVYQLDNGILEYFATQGSAHYHGECFVFDRRVGVDGALAETGTLQCFACLGPVSLEDQKNPLYIPDISCPRCADLHKESIANAELINHTV